MTLRGAAARSLAFALLAACAGAPELATEDDVLALEAAALAGDRSAIRESFQLRDRILPGANLEIDDMLLGSTIRRWPRLFLEELQRYDADGSLYLDGILGNTFLNRYTITLDAERGVLVMRAR